MSWSSPGLRQRTTSQKRDSAEMCALIKRRDAAEAEVLRRRGDHAGFTTARAALDAVLLELVVLRAREAGTDG